MTRVEWYHLLKERHICPSCKRQDAYTLAGRTYCMECAEKMRENHSVHDKDPEVRKRSAARSKARREKLKAAGLCTACGKEPAYPGLTRCAVCHAKQQRACRASYKRHHASPRLGGEICWQCNKRTVEDGHRLCKVCYVAKLAAVKDNLKKGRECDDRIHRREDHGGPGL